MVLLFPDSDAELGHFNPRPTCKALSGSLISLNRVVATN